MKRRIIRWALLCLVITLISGVVLGGTAMLHRGAGIKARELSSNNGFYCALQADSLPTGAVVCVHAEDGSLLHSVSVDARGHALLGPLPPRGVYELQFPDGTSGSFFLAANAAVTALSGAVADDGEILYYIVQTQE